MFTPNTTLRRFAPAMLAGLALFVGAACGEIDDDPTQGEAYATRIAPLPASFCQVNVQGRGMVSVEDEYVAGVVACENGNAPPEALKAQAIAARTYAAFISGNRAGGTLVDSQRDQVFTCGRAPGPEHFEAARATSGQVLTHNGKLIASFYVSGVRPSSNSCVPSARDRANASSIDASVERHVTYNTGRVGNNVQPSSLGHPSNAANRGAMSQNGSSCLANQGRSVASIMRYYYGDDVRITQLGGSCVQEVPDTPEPPPGGGDGGSTSDPPGKDGGPACTTAAQGVTIQPRSSWGAQAPRYNRPAHTPNRITIHHTVQGTNIDGAAAVRSVQSYHRNNRGWADIGYHFLISRDGTVYEGNPEGRQGAHVLNQNSGNLGISLIGNYDREQPNEAQIRSAAALVRHLSDKYGISIDRQKIKGHGERMATACPGNNVDLDAIVAMAKADAVCDEPEEEQELELPDIELAGNASYPFVRITGLEGETVIDSVYYARSTLNVAADSVTSSAGTTNANAATGEPDVEECDQVGSNAAIVGTGGELVLKFDDPVKGGERIAIVSSASGAESCRRGGRIDVAVSVDGEEWITVNEGITSDATALPPIGEIEFITPEGETTTIDTSFTADASQNIVRVEYYAEKFPLGASDDVEGNFPVDYSFTRTGRRRLSVWGYDSSGAAIAMAEKYVVVEPNASTFEFARPRPGKVYRPDMFFEVASGNSGLARVEYQRGDGSRLATITDRGAGGFPFSITLDAFGERTFIAVGYDSSGAEIGRAKVTVTVSDQGGTVPPGSGDPPGTGEVPPTNTSAAEALAQASFSYGNGRRSGGYCWRGVKTAALNANISEGYNWPALQSRGPCSSYNFALSAYCFKRQADANPNVLRDRYGMQRINVDPRNAPRGAIIAYDPGCAGFNRTHGHIEVAQGNGTACSDYCGNIRSGAASCASVYTHVQ